MKKIVITIFAVLALTATSCSKWLDVNSDPNAVSEVENGLVIPSIELNLLNTSGFYGHMLGSFFVENYSIKPGGPQYLGFGHWDTSTISGAMSSGYTNYFNQEIYTKVIGNATSIRKTAEAEGNWGDYLAATVLRVYGFQMLADAFGETPYSESMDVANLAPKYDDGKDVYAGILAELNDALSKVNASDKVSDNMLFSSSSDVNNWIQFANALKLRILMRECGAVDVKSELSSLVAQNNFPKEDIGFVDCWTNQIGLDNPVYDEVVRVRGDVGTGRTIEICAHTALSAAMMDVNDGRLPAIFNPSVKYNNYEGDFIDEQQSKEIDAGYFGKKADKDQENTFAEIKITYDSPVYLITVAETEFFLAEYYAKFGNNNAQAQAHYEAAIDASFATHGVSGASDIYAAGSKYAWNASKYQELIGIQKWIALANINGFESWCEVRRTGYPAFGPKTGKEIYAIWKDLADKNVADGKANPTPLAADLIEKGAIVPGTIFTPVNVVGLPANTMIGRLMYASGSTTTNTNAPAQKDPATKVFWAK